MTQKTINLFVNEIYRKPPKKNYPTNKTDVYQLNDIWSLDILVLRDYGAENNGGRSFVLVLFDNSPKFGWTVSLKNKNFQTIKDFFGNILISSKRKPRLIETDGGKEITGGFTGVSYWRQLLEAVY